jgi:hypothetical protein
MSTNVAFYLVSRIMLEGSGLILYLLSNIIILCQSFFEIKFCAALVLKKNGKKCQRLQKKILRKNQ